MTAYINRLVKCGYTKERAFEVCCDFLRNLGIVDLECFIYSMEKKNVDKV